MKFIQEALKNFRRLGDENEPTDHEEQASSDELDFDLDGTTSDTPPDDEQPSGDELDFDLDGEADPEANPTPDGELTLDGEPTETEPEGTEASIDNVANRASEDPNRRGLIRTVKGTHLVYKRESEDGTFEELWVFNVGDLKNEMQVRKAILAGTDIPTNATSSPDGKQEYSIWTSGNMEMLKITGLPS